MAGPIPPPPLKAVFVFQAGQYGWSEQWWLGSNGQTARTALTAAFTTVPARAAMLASNRYMTDLYVVNPALPGTSSYFNVEKSDVGAGSPQNLPDTAWNAYRLLVTAGTYQRQVWIRGLRDLDITFTPAGQLIVADTFTRALRAWVIAIRGAGFLLKVVDRNPAVNPITTVAGLGADVAGRVTVTSVAHGLRVGLPVGITGVIGLNTNQRKPGRKGVNGRWTVVAVTDANTFTIPLPTSTLGGNPLWQSGGKVQSKIPAYVPLDLNRSISPTAAGERRPGRVKDVAKGRNAARTRSFT